MSSDQDKHTNVFHLPAPASAADLEALEAALKLRLRLIRKQKKKALTECAPVPPLPGPKRKSGVAYRAVERRMSEFRALHRDLTPFEADMRFLRIHGDFIENVGLRIGGGQGSQKSRRVRLLNIALKGKTERDRAWWSHVFGAIARGRVSINNPEVPTDMAYLTLAARYAMLLGADPN